MSNLSRKLTVTLKAPQVEREYVIDFPNTGKMMDMELLKLQISDGKYDVLKYSFNPSFIQQATIIDAIATFNTLIPQLKQDLNVKSLMELSYEQMSIVVAAYVEQFAPWYEEWLALLNVPKEVKQEEEAK